MTLTIKPAEQCTFDQISLGEIMLRLDPARAGCAPPGISRFGKAAANTTPRAGSGNVSVCEPRVHGPRRQRGGPPRRGSRDAGRRRHGFHPVARGRRQRTHRPQRPEFHRARLRTPRRGRRIGSRPHRVSQLQPGDFDWDHIFGRLGVRWFHTGGIFAALSETTARLAWRPFRRPNGMERS